MSDECVQIGDTMSHEVSDLNHVFGVTRVVIDPQRYLTRLLMNLPATPISQIEQWLPHRWNLRNSAPSG